MCKRDRRRAVPQSFPSQGTSHRKPGSQLCGACRHLRKEGTMKVLLSGIVGAIVLGVIAAVVLSMAQELLIRPL